MLISADGLGLPLQVLQAYRRSAHAERSADASCHLPWWLLAGIGHTESGNAEGGRIYSDGTTRGRILGPRLDGSIPGDAIVHDTDHGVLDGDRVFDRAVGPMQFIPSTWRVWGTDGNADGKADPNNIYDATLAAARYLCADDRDLATSAGMRAAILSYNHSSAYLATVLAWGRAYRDGAVTVSDSTLPVVSDVTRVRPPLSSRPPTLHHERAVQLRNDDVVPEWRPVADDLAVGTHIERTTPGRTNGRGADADRVPESNLAVLGAVGFAKSHPGAWHAQRPDLRRPDADR